MASFLSELYNIIIKFRSFHFQLILFTITYMFRQKYSHLHNQNNFLILIKKKSKKRRTIIRLELSKQTIFLSHAQTSNEINLHIN